MSQGMKIERIGPDLELIRAVTDLIRASRGHAAEHGVAQIVELVAAPPWLLAPEDE